ncbi:helix-turn-helix domain-containing protein [Streptomyces antimycoticus]|uniref:helix-turn-helix domain-containing protein n=1 Tax=Streptomyces antimycoticus TaxID=68175 RepID=UPI0036ECF957
MKIRADIAALIVEGHSDAAIAARVGCHRATVNRARNVMKQQSADPVERLYAEELPTGRVTEYRPQRQPTSPAQAAANRALLAEALREDRASRRQTATVTALPAYSDIHHRRAQRPTRKAA